MAFAHPIDLYQHIYTDVCRWYAHGQIPKAVAAHDKQRVLHQTMNTKETPLSLIVVDEIDQLPNDLLHQVFCWKRVIFVGITNDATMLTKKLSRLQTLPHYMIIPPYTTDQIMTIIQTKWQAEEPLITSNALQLCTRKIAACSGDLRKAIGLCLCAIQIADVENANMITVAHILQAIKRVSGPNEQAISDGLNLHQKALLISIVKLQQQTTKISSPSWTVRTVKAIIKFFCATFIIQS